MDAFTSKRRPCVPTNRRDHRSQIRRLDWHSCALQAQIGIEVGPDRLRPGRQRTRRLPACRPVQRYPTDHAAARRHRRGWHTALLNRRPASSLQASVPPGSIAVPQSVPPVLKRSTPAPTPATPAVDLTRARTSERGFGGVTGADTGFRYHAHAGASGVIWLGRR